ncbi:MAG: cell division protein FtsA [Candidatus Paceibacterota bacterium]|jgi:cell division protein FtsA
MHNIAVGIDIGSAVTKVIVAESQSGEKTKPRVIGVGFSVTEGVRHGYIVDAEEAAKSIRLAIDQAQKSSGYRIEKAYFAIGGAGLQGITGSATLSFDKESTIGPSDIEQALEQAQAELRAEDIRNREVIHAIPLSYKIDGKVVYGKPIGMSAATFEIKAFFVTALAQHLSNLISAAKLARIEIEDIIAAPVAASIALLTKSQRVAGCGLLTFGAETVSLGVFENDVPISIEVYPLGSRDITNDIALGFKVSLDEAERIKVSRPESLPYPRKKIEEIVKARLEDVCDFAQSTLKRIGKAGLLPAGVFITGGGAQSNYIEELVKEKLKLPAKKVTKFDGESKVPLAEGKWAIAYGLATIGCESGDENGINLTGRFVKGSGSLSRIIRVISRFFKKILP